MLRHIRTAALLLGLLTVLTGVIYPLVVTVVAQAVFPWQANGSLVKHPRLIRQLVRKDGERAGQELLGPSETWVGSELIGQSFTDPKYFWSRPSATAPVAYNGLGGSGSNQAATNPALVEAVRERIAKLQSADPGNQAQIPVDLVTTSSSGLDPHISVAAALYQVSRVAQARKSDSTTLNAIVQSHVEGPTLGVFGQSRVNVLKLNLDLDAYFSQRSAKNASTTP